MANTKKKILFLCTGNSCRSQMAEGLARHFQSDLCDVYSAGTHPKGLDPLAMQAMQEIGIDISSHTSKPLSSLQHISFDFVITVCDHAHETCPFIPGAKMIHVGFEDPPRLAQAASNHEEKMLHYRRVRDEIKKFILQLPKVFTS